jgi:hypothetical protein
MVKKNQTLRAYITLISKHNIIIEMIHQNGLGIVYFSRQEFFA